MNSVRPLPVAADRRLTKRDIEPFVDRDELATALGHAVQERWLRYRIRDGMPHYLIAGKIRFRVSEVVEWLERHGHIERRGH